MDNNKKNIKIIIIIAFVLVLIAFVILTSLNTKNNDTKKNNIKLTTDYSMFFTIEDCVNRYFSYISDGESDKLMNVLNSDYVKENNINIDNVVNILDFSNLRDNVISFKSLKTYEKNISSTKITYYVNGKVYSETSEDTTFLTEYYVIVNVDKGSDTFDIMPCDSSTFEGEING